MPQNLAQHYDAIPFPSLPIARSQPEFLESLARLRGMRPAPAAQARVLELGCALGRNLSPLAERYPEASFLGIDQSARQIEIAAQTARDASLANVEFRQGDIRDLGTELGTFDYIIAHGVYSWVDAAVRDKLLVICRDHLAPQGVAYVSYKTYPGWKVHEMLRHAMQYDARNVSTASEKMTRSRMLLEFLRTSLTEDNPYDALVQEALSQLTRQGDDYLWHDHLEPHSHPVFFQQFIEHAREHGLQIAGEATLGIRWLDDLGPESERELAGITQDPLLKEQFRDVIRNRTMRQSLLCHQALELAQRVTSEALEGMYLEGSLQPETAEVDLQGTSAARFAAAGGLRLSATMPLAKAALVHLGKAWPAYVSLADLVSAACARVEAAGGASPIPPEEIQRLKDNLLQCVLGQVVRLHTHPAAFVAAPTDKPQASLIARNEAKHAEVVTNRRHDAVRLDPFEQQVLQWLDGTRSHAQLVEQLAAEVAEGRLVAMQHQQRVSTYDEAKRVLDIALPESLERLARSALLVA